MNGMSPFYTAGGAECGIKMRTGKMQTCSMHKLPASMQRQQSALYIAVTAKHLYNQQLLSLCIEMVAAWRPAPQLLGPILQSAEAL